MPPLTHIPPARLVPGLYIALAILAIVLAPKNPTLALALLALAGLALWLRAPRPEASCHVGSNTWTVRYGNEVVHLRLDEIAEVRIDHPLAGPDRVQVLMQSGLCLPLPDEALPERARLISALRARKVTVHIK